MQTSATIISLVGQAWARDANGALRALKVGDRLENGETLVSAAGSRIDLQFDQGQIVTVLGEHEVALDELLPAAAPGQPQTEAAQETAAAGEAAPDIPASQPDQEGQSEGHGFVQLVRLDETIEADGLTPLNVSRIVERIEPWSMSLDNTADTLPRRLEHVGRDEHAPREHSVIATPKSSISIDVIAGDDIINAAEAAGDVTVSGTVGQDVKAGDTVTITVNGKTYTTTVNADGKTWQVDVPGAELVADNSVHASVTTSNAAGNKSSAETERPYEIQIGQPTANPIAPISSADGLPFTLDAGNNFNDPDGDPLTFSATNLPDGLSIDPDTGKISGTLDRSASQGGTNNDGVYTVVITATDPAGNTVSETVELTITNPPPVALNDLGVTDEDTPLHVDASNGVLANDSDPDGDPISISAINGDTAKVGTQVAGSSGGLFTIHPDGSYSFDPNGEFDSLAAGEVHITTIEYTISDGEGGFDTATLAVRVHGVNNPPTPVDSIDDQADDDATTITLIQAADFFDDIDHNDVLTYSATGLPTGLSIDPDTGEISGTLDSSASQHAWQGVYNVTVTATDLQGASASQSFTWTVSNPAPQAQDDFGSTDEDQILTVDAAAGVLNNDIDEDELTVTPISKVLGSHGGLFTLHADGSYEFDPNGDFDDLAQGESRETSYTYTVTDADGATDTATLTITVNGVNNAPTAVGTIADQTNDDGNTISGLDVSGYFDDIDASDELEYSASGLPAGLSIDPVTGIISGQLDSSASQGGQNGVHTVTITATDPHGASTTQTFDWTVRNPAPVAQDDVNTTDENTALQADKTDGVLANDHDPDGDDLVVAEVNGDAAKVGTQVAGSHGGLFTLHADGSYSFDPNGEYDSLAAGDSTTTSITYTVSDGEGGTDTATLTITVNGVNNAPTAVGTIADQTSDDADTISGLVVASYFDDVDSGDVLTYSATGLPEGLSIDADTGLISGTIDRSASQGAPNGEHSVTITATDSQGATAEQTFTWTVNNPAPIAKDDTATTYEDTPLHVDADNGVLANDHDPDGDPLSVTSFEINGTTYNAGDTATIAGIGELTLKSDGSYDFIPEDDWNGTVPTITYTIDDGEGGTATATLTITVEPVVDITLSADPQIDEGDQITLTASVENPVQDKPLHVILDNGQTITIAVGETEGSILVDSRPDDAYIQGTTTASFKVFSASGGSEHINDSSFGSEVTVEIVDNADATSVALTASPDLTEAGGDLTYTLTLGNEVRAGDDPVEVSFKDLNGDTQTIEITSGTTGSVTVTIPSDLYEDVYKEDPQDVVIATDVSVTGGADFEALDTVTVGTIEITDTIDPVYARIEVDHDAVLEGGELTYTITLVDESGNAVKVADGKDVTIELEWSGAAANLDDVDQLPTSITIDGGDDSANFTVKTKEDQIVELSEPLTVNITGVVDNDGTNIGFEDLRVDTNNNHATSHVLDAPTITAEQITVHESGIHDTDDNSNIIDGVLRIAAPSGLEKISIAGTELTLAQLENLGTTNQTITIAGHGTITLTESTMVETANGKPAVWEVNFTYTLTDPQTHTTQGADEALKDIDLGVTASDPVSGAQVNGTGTLGVLVIDDVPTVKLTGVELDEAIVEEAHISGAKGTATVDFSNAFDIDHGADGNAGTAYELVIKDTDTGLTDMATGDDVVLIDNNGTIEGRTANSNELVFTIAVDADGKVTLTQLRALHHDDPLTPDDQVNIANGAIYLKATATDGDGDTASAEVNISDRFVFQDDGPTVADLTDGITLDEKHLLLGSEPDTNQTTSTIVRFKDIDFGADGFGDVRFSDETLTRLEEKKLHSNDIELEYILSQDGHTLTAYRGNDHTEANKIFTAEIVGLPSEPGYQLTLHGPLDHLNQDGDSLTSLDLPFENVLIIDGDGDTAVTRFNVKILDDKPSTEPRKIILDEDTDKTFNANADATQDNTIVTDSPTFGTATVNSDGTITYEPKDNYSGSDSFTYTTTINGVVKTFEVDVTVNPVADKPNLGHGDETGHVDKVTIKTNEDESKKLGLKLPVITDAEQHQNATDEDYPERLGAIILTPGGDGFVDDAKLVTGSKELTPVDGKITIVITDTANSDTPKVDYHTNDVPTKNESDGVYYLTQDEYEAITAHPAEDRHENFQVKVEVTSYEVDMDGEPLDGIDGAKSEQTITVDVWAVTDPVVLKLKEDPDQTYITILDGNETADIVINEDTAFDLTAILNPNEFKDIDGSETRYLGLDGLPDGTIVTVDGKEYIIGNPNTPTFVFDGSALPAFEMPGDQTNLPQLSIQPPQDFSGDLTNIRVILAAQDCDDDSQDAQPIIESDDVTLNLYILPTAGDVNKNSVHTIDEDSPVAFLSGIKVTDDSRDLATGGEVITKVKFTLPTDANGEWKLTDQPNNSDGWSISGSGTGPYTITFNDDTNQGQVLDHEQRMELLSQFKVTPPAHSSLDAEDWKIDVTTVDSQVVNGTTVTSDPVTTKHEVTITVKPVAEKVDTDTDGDNTLDLTINDNHVFTSQGKEDEWFKLGTETGFRLSEGWSNQDGKWVDDGNGNWSDDLTGGRSEDTFALLTPYKTKNNDARANADLDGKLEGSVFTYSDGTNTITLPFAGEPVRIPMQYLDSVEFKAPKDWAGVVKVKVEAHTIDYDEDDPSITSEATSGEAWLTNLIVEPRADQVTLRVDGIIKTLEDKPVELRINPTSSDPNETFNITIEGIPRGAKITYDGTDYDTMSDPLPTGLIEENDGSFKLTIENFDKTKQPELTPPKDSNETISLNVTAESVDTLVYIDKDGVSQTITDTGLDKTHTLPITVEVQGVPDEPSVTINNSHVYFEDGADDKEASQEGLGPLEVKLSDLITELKSGETGVDGTGPDGSETVTLRISDLPEGFSLKGAGPTLGSGSGTERVWVISAGDLENVTIVAPQHFSGTVTFTAQPVVTENDNPSAVFFDKQNISFKVTPVPEASLSISSDLVEDQVGELQLAPVGSDPKEYISVVRIAASDLQGVTLYEDAAGETPLVANSDGDYIIHNQKTSGAPSVYVKGPANFGDSIKLDIHYQVTNPSTNNPLHEEVSGWQKEEHTLHFKPVTDKIEVSLGDITGDNVTITNDTTKLDGAGTVTVELKIDQVADENANNQKDTDGSEQLTHILISGVPEGVSVNGAVETAKGQWLIIVDDTFFEASTDNPEGQLIQNLEFVVSKHAADFTEKILVTAYSKDKGADTYKKASLDWTLKHTHSDGSGDSNLPDEVTLEAEDYTGKEDEPFTLDKVVTGTIIGTNSAYNITITIRTSPDDETRFDGVTRTQVMEDGNPVILWTATETVDNSESGQAKLEELLGRIKVTPPKDANSNNLADGKLKLDINLAAHADGLSKNADATPEVDIEPVTDDFTVVVSSNSVDEGEDIPLSISLPADHVDGELGTGWTIVDDMVYIHIADNGLEGVLVGAGDVPLEPFIGEPPEGTPTGDTLYAVNKDALSGLKFVPDNADYPHQTGSLDVTVLVKHKEAGADNIETSTGTGSLAIHPSNSGYEAKITAVGNEFQGFENDELIELVLTGVSLVDSNEIIHSAFISGLPSGFTVWTGDSTNPEMANNAGANTWAIPLNNGDLPTIFIKPPKNWSGTLEGLTLTVMSGHDGLSPRADEIDFKLVINPVADGLTMEPTLSFGDAGDRIALNLNASMKDPEKATGADGDQHTERTTLELSGFPDGQKVLFFIGNSEEPLGEPQASYDENSNTWTLTGLTQKDLNELKFLHAETNGNETISVKAWTYEVDADGNQVGASSALVGPTDVKINITPTVPTSGDDHFLWEQGKLIDGFGGEDTVQLRYGDNLEGNDFNWLKNIEIIDMRGSGENKIIGLGIEDVLEMTDDQNVLKIFGDSEDSIKLASNWGEGVENGDYVTYTGTFDGNNVTLQIHDSIQTEIIIDG